MPTAIFVDAGYFLKRFPSVYPDRNATDGVLVARSLHEMALDHLRQRGDDDRRDLYRIFVYDCPPLLKKAQHPITSRSIDFAATATAQFRLDFHQQLKCLRKVALRLGRLQDRRAWRMKPERLRALLRKQLDFSELTDEDFVYDVKQKGTDMRVGLDIASVSYKVRPIRSYWWRATPISFPRRNSHDGRVLISFSIRCGVQSQTTYMNTWTDCDQHVRDLRASKQRGD